jgi:putative Mg2+ transporter-C (MgtC) family protein
MLSLHQILLRLTVAALLGAAIGVERDLRRRPAGIRTSLCVTLGAALFTILSAAIAQSFGDSGSTRIASNIVQGIGFLGAGAIIREKGGIVGMTTAATIWLEAAIGMAVAGGLYALAGYSTGLVLFALIALAWMEQLFGLKPRIVMLRISASQSQHIAGEVQHLLEELKINSHHFRVFMEGTNTVVEFEADVSHSKQETILARLHREGITSEVIAAQSRE